MRTIHADLTAAMKATSRVPVITATVENRWEAVRRWDFTQLNSSTTVNARHDVAVAGDESVTRVRYDATNIKRNHVTDAGALTPANWDVWITDVVGAASGPVACAAKGAYVAVVYGNGNGVWLYESTDYGATFGAAALIWTTGVTLQDLAIAYKNSSGDLLIAAVTTTQLVINKRTAGVFAGAVTHGTTQASLNGVAVTYNGDYEIVCTGTETTTLKPTIWSNGYGDGFDIALNTFGSWLVQIQGQSLVATYQAPFICFDSGYRITFVDLPLYVGGETRTYFTYLHEELSWAAGALGWRSPVPRNHHITQGLAIAKGTSYVYASAYDGVWRAAVAPVALDVSADVLALDVSEEQFDGAGHIDLDNTDAYYAGPPAPIQRGNRVKLELGYYTVSGNRTSRLQDHWVTGWEYRRTGGVSTLRVFLEGGWRRLRRQRNRTTIAHDTGTYKVIIGAALARAGFFVNTAAASTRYNTIAQKFLIDPRDSGYEALRRALAFVADRILLREDGEAAIIEALTSDATDYDITAQNHPLLDIRHGQLAPPVNEVHGISQTGTSLIASPKTDYAEAEYGLGELEQQRDAASTSGTNAANTALAHLRQRALDRRTGSLILQPVVNLELLDVLEFGESAIGVADVQGRVYGIRWRYERKSETFAQVVEVGPL